MRKIFSFILIFALLCTLTSCQSYHSSVFKDEDVVRDPNYSFNNKVENYDDTYFDMIDGIAYDLVSLSTENGDTFSMAGSDLEEKRASYVYNKMKEIGLKNVEYIPVIMDLWKLDSFTIKYPCTCTEAGFFTTTKVGVHPANFDYKDEEIEFVNVCAGEEEDYKNLDVTGKGVILNDSVDLLNKLNRAKEHGAISVIYNANFSYSTSETIFDISLKIPDEMTVFAIPYTQYNTMVNEIDDYSSAIFTLNGKSEIVQDGSTNFVVGEIEGTEKDKYIYVTANMDTYWQGYYSSDVNIAEMLGIANTFINVEKPKYTIRFLATTGTEFGDIDTFSKNVGIQNYLSSIDTSNIIASFVLNGSKPFSLGVFMETNCSEDAFNIVESFNNTFDSKLYGIINIVENVIDDTTEANIWKDYVANVVLQAESNHSLYSLIYGSSSDNISLSIDKQVELFLRDYYVGLIQNF